MATYKFPDEENNGIKYIMRGIKGILFVCKLLFAKIDMPHPFPHVEEEQIDPEDLMINTDFISEMIPVISQNYSEKNSERLENSIAAFDHLMGVVLDGT